MRHLGIPFFVFGSMLAGPVFASEMEEVIVTAQKRQQSILDVPVTMDVVSGDYIERTNTRELDELSRVLPNVVIQEQAVSLPSFNIRGITDDSAAVSATPRISVYLDGIDISKKTVSSVALFDIERIEVLKGPQPTLFGVAAANGAVSMISALPGDELEANLQFGVQNYSGYDLTGAVNVPLSDIFSLRVAGLYRESDGTVDNLACSANSYNPSGQVFNEVGELQPCADGDLNGVSVEAARVSLRAQTNSIDAVLRYAFENNDQPGISFKSGSIAPFAGDTNPYTDAELSLGSLLGIDREVESLDAAVTWTINDNLELTVDGYMKDVELSEYFDGDGSGLRLYDAYFDNDADLSGFGARLVFNAGDRIEGFVGFSQTNDESILPFSIFFDPYQRGVFDATREALAAANPGIPLDQNIATDASLAEINALRAQLVGALFNADGTPISSPDPTVPDFVVTGPFVFEADLEITSYVAEATYALTDSLSLTGGLRFIDETRFTRNFGAFAAEADFDDVLPRVALNYAATDNISVYATYAQGRRSPVVDPNFGATQITAAEIVDSFDVGMKFQGTRMTATAAVFAYTYTDYQQSFTDAATLQSITVTVGDSDMYGFEGSIDYLLSEQTRIGANIGLLDATFADSTDQGVAFDYAGNNFRLAPEVSTALFANHVIPLGEWEIEIDGIAAYQSEVFFESSNYPGLSQDGYWIADASLKLRPAAGQWQVEVFADNLFDEEFLIDAGNTGGGIGIPTFVRGMPRVAGIRAYASF